MNFREIESITHAEGLKAKCLLCGEVMTRNHTRRHATETHGYPTGGDFTLVIDGPRILNPPAARPVELLRLRTSKWA